MSPVFRGGCGAVRRFDVLDQDLPLAAGVHAEHLWLLFQLLFTPSFTNITLPFDAIQFRA